MRSFAHVPMSSGVYRAYCGDRCMYVGSTICLRARLRSHRLKKICDRWEWELVPEQDLGRVEQERIDQLSPELNRYRAPMMERRVDPHEVVKLSLDREMHSAIQKAAGFTREAKVTIIRRAIVHYLAQLGVAIVPPKKKAGR